MLDALCAKPALAIIFLSSFVCLSVCLSFCHDPVQFKPMLCKDTEFSLCDIA